MTADHVANLKAKRYGACAGLLAQQFTKIPVESLSGLTPSCLAFFQYETIRCITPEQVVPIPGEAFAGLTEYQVDTIKNVTFAAMSIDQLSHISSASCNGISKVHIAILKPEKMVAFKHDCIENFRVSTTSTLSPEQAQNIPPAAFSGFDCNIKYTD